MFHGHRGVIAVLGLYAAAGCGEPYVERPPAPDNAGIHGFASGCYTLDATSPGSSNTRWLEASGDGEGFAFSATSQAEGAKLHLRASDLGTYLLYDADRHYLVTDADDHLARTDALLSDVLLIDDTYVSPAEWELQVSAHDDTRFQLRQRATGRYLTTTGLTDDESDADAAVVALYPADGCAGFPEMTLDAEGEVEARTWPDGDLYGIVDAHSHIFSNFGFGGGGLFHGAPYHRLGVEHALASCELYHGDEGRKDIVGYLFNGLTALDIDAFLTVFLAGAAPEFNHHTDGYPTFTDWPNTWHSSTHQTQYYRWLERAWRGGLRLVVSHATTNSVLCDMVVGLGSQEVRYACNDMVAVDRIIAENYAMERYIDAQWGGPGQGWYRVVRTPEEARTVIAAGKMAVVLGIETSNLFDCFLTPREGFEPCDVDSVRAKLDDYYARGIRAIFPVHKLDNAFSAGDGDRNVGQIGSFFCTGHDSNFVTDCPDVPSVFDHGDVRFGGLNNPRKVYDSPAPHDMSDFARRPIATVSPFLPQLQEPALVGDYCQNAGLTPLGEELMLDLMRRGMIIEVDHLPKRSFQRAYELLVEHDYPAAGTHGNTNRGVIFQLGGISATGLGRCQAADRTGAMGEDLANRVMEIEANGGYPASGFSFDLNGFAGGPRPRFGDDSPCTDPQTNPITYPFTAYAGDVTFTEPHLGERTVDFNTEGMLHIGLLPELIEDARHDGVTDDALEPLFRSAEGYIRMWELAEQRSTSIPPP